jgi:hypothetical protein
MQQMPVRLVRLRLMLMEVRMPVRLRQIQARVFFLWLVPQMMLIPLMLMPLVPRMPLVVPLMPLVVPPMQMVQLIQLVPLMRVVPPMPPLMNACL